MKTYEIHLLFNSGAERIIECESEKEMNDFFNQISHCEGPEHGEDIGDDIIVRVSEISYMEKIVNGA